MQALYSQPLTIYDRGRKRQPDLDRTTTTTHTVPPTGAFATTAHAGIRSCNGLYVWRKMVSSREGGGKPTRQDDKS
jgi:hypothetical protein